MNTSHPRPIQSFVRRQGRMTASQKQALATEWKNYGVNIENGLIHAQPLFENAHPLIIEIGFGMGDSLIDLALKYLNYNFIGIEVHRPGVGALLAKIKAHALNNIKIYCESAGEVLTHCIADNSIQAFLIYFPDPWPKKKHHKRRLIQTDFLKKLHSKLISQGEIHIATDWENYAEQIAATFTTLPFFSRIDHSQLAIPIQRGQTKFERRGEMLGHQIFDFIYQKTAN